MYRRFLNNKDYLGIITQEALDQLTRGDETRFEQAEQAAEASIVDYLSESYEVEQELNRGKYIFDYDRKISYPIGSHFRLNGEICEVLQSINGYKEPSDVEYWKESEDFVNMAQLYFCQSQNLRSLSSIQHLTALCNRLLIEELHRFLH